MSHRTARTGGNGSVALVSTSRVLFVKGRTCEGGHTEGKAGHYREQGEPLDRESIWGVIVTREHVRHNKSGITHQDRAKINHSRGLPYQVKPLRSGGICETNAERG
jgi:hypothetical protein